MSKYLILLGFMLFGCMPEVKITQVVPDEAKPYILKFEQKCSIKSNISVVFKPLPSEYFAYCSNFSPNDIRNTIYINSDFWSRITDADKELLFAHELGHCIKNRTHDSTLTILGSYPNAPKTVMHPIPFGFSVVFKEFESYYYNEICN